MKQKVVITVGLPASGKSTKYRELVRTDENWKRVNKDDLRNMLDDGSFSSKNEAYATLIMENIIVLSLSTMKNVVIDNTHLNPKTFTYVVEMIRKVYNRNEVEIELDDSFLDVDYLECMNRNERRTVGQIPAPVIATMYESYLRDTSRSFYRDLLVEIEDKYK